MSDDDMKAELERLRRKNEALKKGASEGIRMKVSDTGGLSVYGMGRFPVTLYKEQWHRASERKLGLLLNRPAKPLLVCLIGLRCCLPS